MVLLAAPQYYRMEERGTNHNRTHYGILVPCSYDNKHQWDGRSLMRI